MDMTYRQLWDAFNALTEIVRKDHLAIPQTAKFRLARMRTQLEVAYAELEQQRVTLLMAHGSEQFRDEEKTISVGWTVVPGTDSYTAYVKAWNAVLDQQLTISVTPIMLAALGDSPDGIEVNEFEQLGELVVDNL